MSDEKTVILRVSLDEGKTEDRMKELVLIMEQTRKAQAALTAERKAGTVSDEDFAKRSVALKNELRAQGQESTALQKNLELYRRAVNGVAGSYDQAQAQLSLAQRQYQQLADSAANGTESTQALTGVIDGLRNTLKATDAQQSLFVRNVGNYPKGENLEALVQQLVKLEEQSKKVVAGSQEANEVEQRRIGFQQAAVQAAAMEGKTYAETTSFIKGYSDALRPAVADLVRLEEEQTKVADTGSEAYRKIGFQIAATQKQIAEVPPETKKVGDALEEIDQKTGAFGGQVGLLRQRFNEAKQGIEIAKGGLTGLKGAIAATGIGVLILALGALYEYFTKTDEGAEDLAAGMAFLKGVFSVLESVVIGAGKALVGVFKDPKQSAKDLLDFLSGQVINRVKAFGVIWDAIRNGDPKALANGVIQFNTGIEKAIDKTKAFAEEAARAGKVAYDLARAGNDLEDAQRDSLVTLEKNKNIIDKLVLSAKDRTLSEKERLANLDAAGKLEEANLNTTIKLATEKLRIATATNDEAERVGKTSDELRDAVAQAAADVERLRGQSASLQQSIQNRRSVLLQQEAADTKAAADKAVAAAEKEAERRLQIRRDAITLEGVLLDRELAQVKAGSDEELSILQRKLNVAHELELNVKGLTIGQKKIADAKYENESLKLLRDFSRQRVLAAYEDSAAANAAELVNVKKGTEQETELRREAIDIQLRKELAALDTRKDNARQEALLRANAAKALVDVDYNAALTKLDQFLGDQRQAIEESNAKGRLTEKQYSEAVLVSDQIAAGARLQLAREFKQDTTELERAASAAKIASIKAVTAAEKAEQAKRMATAEQLGNDLAALFTETVATTGATLQDFAAKALILMIDTMEKTVIAAQVKIIAESFASADSIATFGVAGLAKSLLIIGAVGTLSEALKAQLTPPAKQFARGTVLQGPSHAQGGIQLYSPSGYHFGEAEGGEPILTAGVSRNKALLAAASAINIAAGGRPLVPSTYLALGGVATPVVRDGLRGEAAPFDYDRMAAAFKKVNVKATIIDVKEGLARDAFTDSIANA